MADELKFLGFTMRIGTPSQIMKGIAGAAHVHANECFVYGQAKDGTIYIDENRVDAETQDEAGPEDKQR